MSIIIDIDTHSGDWPDSADAVIERGIHAVLAHQDIEEAEASVVLGDDDFVQVLNRDYRDKDKPTNVLSFPQDLPMMGDLVFAYGVVKREAEEQSKTFENHLLHLTVHGSLHLLGYDHIDDGEAEAMEAIEIAVLHGLGVKNPYEIF
ncbi:MAG: rRNA maturation RNase YbeY [Alphaproteobacteria bacterium]|nr:rRNA maturation RNase YbeY [Alphaproteobacteria bacterium]